MSTAGIVWNRIMTLVPEAPISRRQALTNATCGFGALALAGMNAKASAAWLKPMESRAPHFRPKAQRVIFLFMRGGPSHVDTFDYKPKLQSSHAQVLHDGKLMASPWTFNRCGDSGLTISSLFPHLAEHADELCVINSMHCDSLAHPGATIQLHTGSTTFVRPSVGAWTLYGLGTGNENLPGFVTINPTAGFGGAQNYGSAFLPAAYQGTPLTGSGSAKPTMSNLGNASITRAAQRRQLDLLQSMNGQLRDRWEEDQRIDAVIESYELGFRMQSAMGGVLDTAGETAATEELYGIGDKATNAFGLQCLMARRMAEAGVRYIEIDNGGWDQHTNLKGQHAARARGVDKPISGLLTDLKQRGMLDDTLVIWGGEFGRKPFVQFATGRGHNNLGFSMWMAGGGSRGGLQFGATDEFGYRAVENRVHTHDFHATILHLLGLDHERLTYRYAGRDFRLTDVHGRVVRALIA